MFNPNHQHYVEFHSRDLRLDAERQRLANAARPANPVVQRLMAAVGQQMVDTGRELLAKSEAERAETPEWEYFGSALS